MKSINFTPMEKNNVVFLTERVAKAVASMPKAAEALFGKRHYAPVLGGHTSAVKATTQYAVRDLTVAQAPAGMDEVA